MKRSTRRELMRRMEKMWLSEDLRTMLRRSKADQLEMLGQVILHYDDLMQRALRDHPDRLGIAAGAHDAIDQAVGRELERHPRAGEVKCRKGCNHCCHTHVGVSAVEAELLGAVVQTGEVQIDLERLRLQAGRDLDQWGELSREERACVFLQDGACAVYEHRPGACRKLNVVSDPQWCDDVTYPGHEVLRMAVHEAEVVWSVLLTRDKSGQMADMLLDALKETVNATDD